MPNDVVINVEGLWKRYGLPLPAVLRRLWGETADGWVLRDINLQVRRGEVLAVLGRNGASKSTLLKVLAGITPPTRGRVDVYGRLFPMIEINGGIHPELTGWENIRLLGTIMGLTPRGIEARMPAIGAFTELAEWLDRPVRKYSTGMVSRLGVGVAAHIDCDVLLIDEALSVGDLRFQNKTLARIAALRDAGTAIVLVTHNLDMAEFLAQRGLVLDGGRIITQGSALDVVRAYEDLVFHAEYERVQRGLPAHPGRTSVTAATARVCTAEGEATAAVAAGAAFSIEVVCTLRSPLRQPVFAVSIVNAVGVVCVVNLSSEAGVCCGDLAGTVRLRLTYPENRLISGAYEVHLAIHDGVSFETVDQLAAIAAFTVHGNLRARGIVDMSPRWHVEETGPEPSA